MEEHATCIFRVESDGGIHVDVIGKFQNFRGLLPP